MGREEAVDFPVLIAGGGVVGLSASLFLERAGVRACLVERHPTTSIHPRARGVNGRTMELMRELGLEDAVREAGASLAPAIGIHHGENLRAVLAARGSGGWFTRRLRARMGRGQAQRGSPVGPCRCTQDELEPVLLGAARARGVDARFHTELTGFEQGPDSVVCTLLDRTSGARSQLRARYVIAADGARSRTRELLGIERSTAVPGAHQINLYFRADLAELVRGREFSMCLIEQPGLRGLFTSINNCDLWVFHVAYDPATEQPEAFTPERCIALIRRAAGVPELAVEMKGALPWESATRIADRYRSGRIFLAGDAAHIMPPWGGFGANSGIQDAHNLAWKLGAALNEGAGDSLLDSYEVERRPLALELGAISASLNDARGLMVMHRSAFGMLWNMRKVFRYLSIGYGYDSAAVALERGRAPGPRSRDLAGRPGTRAPHVWLNGQRSTLDWLGRGFVWWLGPSAEGWAEALQLTAADAPRALQVLRLGRDVHDPRHSVSRAFGIGSAGALLVRPDGFVAFRARTGPRSIANAADELRGMWPRLLGRQLSAARA